MSTQTFTVAPSVERILTKQTWTKTLTLTKKRATDTQTSNIGFRIRVLTMQMFTVVPSIEWILAKQTWSETFTLTKKTGLLTHKRSISVSVVGLQTTQTLTHCILNRATEYRNVNCSSIRNRSTDNNNIFSL